MLLAFHEIFMPKALSILGIARLVEVVHVELANETGEVVVLKVTW